MTQYERDQLVVLRKSRDKQMTQKQVGEELGLSQRQASRLLRKLKTEGEKVWRHMACGAGSRTRG